jgi:hypothetical protein
MEFLQNRQRETDDDPDEDPDPPQPSGHPPNELYKLVALQCSLSVSQLRPDSRLEADLALDSLGRVELLSAIEDGLGVYVDDSIWG